MKRTVLGVVIGFLAAATLAWALEVKLPTRTTARATVVVDELGSILFGSTPAKVEVTNCQTGTPAMVVKDANGVVIGTPSRPVTQGSSVYVVRDIGGLPVEMIVDQFHIASTGSQTYLEYESPDCSGTPYLQDSGVSGGGGAFYPGSYAGGSAPLVYATGSFQSRTIHSYERTDQMTCNPNYPPDGTVLVVSPSATLDLSQFTPPYSLVAGP